MGFFTNTNASSMIGLVGLCAAATSIVVQVLKNVIPKSFPTKILTTIVSFIVVLGYTFGFETVTIPTLVSSIFSGFVVSFVSMFGFDSLKETIGRFTDGELINGKEDK